MAVAPRELTRREQDFRDIFELATSHYQSRDQESITALMRETNERPAQDVHALIGILRDTGQDSLAAELVAATARTEPHRVLAVLERLRIDEHNDDERLLLAAGERRDRGLVKLVETLAQQGWLDEVFTMLRADSALPWWQRLALRRALRRKDVQGQIRRSFVTSGAHQGRHQRLTTGRYLAYVPLAFVLGLPLLRLSSVGSSAAAAFAVSASVLGILAWRVRIAVTSGPGSSIWLGSSVLLTSVLVATLFLGAATGYVFEPLGGAMLNLLTWSF